MARSPRFRGACRAARALGAAGVGAIACALVLPSAVAQTMRTSVPTTPPARAVSRAPAGTSGAKPKEPDAGATPPAGPSVASTGSLVDAGVVEARTLDGGTHVFKFSEIDIEGRLKRPQLVYFLRRVRAEFAADDLGHRTFLREMSETRREPSF